MFGAIALSKKELEHIKNFRYKTNPLTPLEVHVFTPYWDFIANYCLPDWLAPNALTLMGVFIPLLEGLLIGYLNVGLD